MGRSRSLGLGALLASLAIAACASLVSPSAAIASTAPTRQKLEVLGWNTYDPLADVWVDGRISNPSQTAVTNVTVSITLFDSAGKALQTATFPADCMVLDGLSSTTFRARRFDDAAAQKMRNVAVSASGVPTVRHPVLIAARIDSRTDSTPWEAWYRQYVGTVTNDQPYDVTATIVYGQERQTDALGLSILDAFRDDSVSGQRLAPGQTATFGFTCVNYYYHPPAALTVLAEALPASTPGIAMETTQVLCAYGAPVAIRGTVRDDGGVTGVPRAAVVYRTSSNGTTWSRPATVTAGSSGTFSVTARPKALTYYAFSFGGRAGLAAPSQPTTVAVYPRVVLSTPSGIGAVPLGKRVKLTGTLSPRHPAGTTVKLLCYSLQGDDWVLGAETTATVTNRGTTASQYGGYVSLPTLGTWRVRAMTPDDAKHAMTVSAIKTIKVGPTSFGIVANRTKVSYARGAVLTGTLLDAEKSPLWDAPVLLQSSSDGGRTYSTAKTLVTDGNGRVRASVKSTSKTTYRFAFAGDELDMGCSSRPRTITSTAVTKTVALPSNWTTFKGRAYWRNLTLSAGKHQILTGCISSVDVVGAHWSILGIRAENGSGPYTAQFKAKGSGRVTITLRCLFWSSRWLPPSSMRVTIW